MALTDKSSVIVPKGFYGKANVLQGFNPQTESLVDLDVTRNTTATRVNEQGLIESVAANVPRRDFLNGGCGELLMEPQRTNLLTYSEDLTLSGYTGTATISASGEIDPRGNTNAEQVTDNSNTVRQEIENILTFTAGANHIQTFYVLKDSNTSRFPEFVLRIFGSGTESSIYMGLNTQTGAKVDRLQNGDSSSKVESIGNYWKVTLQARHFNDGNADITSQIRPAFGTTIGVSNVAAKGSVVYFGNQLEIGEYESSYIPTSGSTVTRNKDLTAIDLSTEGVDEQYAVLFNVKADGGRLLMKSAGAGIDLDIKNSGKFAMLVDLNTITFKFPDNGQPQTELVYEKPADFRDIEFEAKLGPVRIEEVIWTEQLQPAEYNAWISGTVSSDFLETDWSAQTDFLNEFRDEDWDYFPVIDTSSGTDFTSAWRDNQLTLFPQLDVSSGTDFRFAWDNNQLTSFPANMFDTLTSPNNDCFTSSWTGTNVIDSQGMENILVSIDTSGANAPSSGVNIDISSNGDTLTAATNSAITSLKGKGWNIVIDGVAQ